MIQVQLKLKLRPSQERQLSRWLFHLTGADQLAEVAAVRGTERRWLPIETLDDPDRDVLMWTPRERIHTKEQLAAFPDLPAGEQRVSSRRHWTWATLWQPLVDPPRERDR